ncbi:DUF4242 domain-containing protein [Shewanella pealeana]|uniref:DUF4242 domain-containing protein n=1 Tax=Shewanella pealeana (strain ATCC 700345 / ANG-SQ1) TaxID=398579 RepID=A8H4M2_SHEPA|nr:DUF4242 domain-containing protein [Shewanella pealeana]ABV87509.1 conserved hypothetical protein [Shewanella pealeana ATCC 700345]
MPKYVIERLLPGAGDLSASDLQGISRKSCDVLEALGPKVQWVESYITDNKIYCVYIAPDESLIRKHAEMGEFPIEAVNQVRTIIDPTTSE